MVIIEKFDRTKTLFRIKALVRYAVTAYAGYRIFYIISTFFFMLGTKSRLDVLEDLQGLGRVYYNEIFYGPTGDK